MEWFESDEAHQASGQPSKGLGTLNHVEWELKSEIIDCWKSKRFADTRMLCAKDGGVVLAHRVVLAALSPFLDTVLNSLPPAMEDVDYCYLVLDDVDSVVLEKFLDSVITGRSSFEENQEDLIDEQLAHLGFSAEAAAHRYRCESMIRSSICLLWGQHMGSKVEAKNCPRV